MGTSHLHRTDFSKQTPITSADVVLNGNWGASPTLDVVAGSNDQRGGIIVTPDTGAAGTPGWTLTFRDGAWDSAPFALVVRAGASPPPSNTTTITTLTIIQSGAFVVGTPIVYDYFVIG